MRQIHVIFIYCFLFWVAGFSQTPSDSLKSALSRATNDIDRVRLLNELAVSFQGSNPNLAQEHATAAINLSRRIKHTAGEATALLTLGNANILKGNYAKALQNFLDAKEIHEKQLETEPGDIQTQNGLARAYGSIGIIFSEQSNYAKALQFHLKAVRIYEQTGNLEKTARVYNNIGIVHQSQGDEFRALDYFIKCLRLQEKIGDGSAGITLTNIGNIYLKRNDKEKARQYYERALKVFEKHPDHRGLGELYNNMGRMHKLSGNTGLALEFYGKALSSFDAGGEKFGASDTYALIGELHFDRKDYTKALSDTEKSLALGNELGIPERIRDSEKMLSEIYRKLNRPDLALEHFTRFTAANDSISNFENVRNSVRAEMNYEFEKKEALRRKEQEKKELVFSEQAKRHRQQMGFLALFILLAGGIVFLVYNRRQLRKTLTLQKELAEYEQKALHLQMNPHFVFNCLGSISSFIVQNGTDQAIKYLSKFSKLMRLTLEYSKESLIPIDKEIESLQNYLELEQLRFNNVFEFTISKSNDIEDDMALPPLLLQPFVENAIIHGLIPGKQPGRIDIGFALSENSLVCTIRDNGIGFNKSQELKETLVSVHKSMALDITRKRLEMMEAFTSKTSKVEIREIKEDSGNILGTEVELLLPVQFMSPDTKRNTL